MNNIELVINRFFDIISGLEEDGSVIELYAIRDYLMREYILTGGESVKYLEIMQIDDIIECNVREDELADIDLNCSKEEIEEAQNLVLYIYDCISEFNYLDYEDDSMNKVFNLVLSYGELRASDSYIYYSIVKLLENITGENYVYINI